MKLRNTGLLGILAGSLFIAACNFGGGSSGGGWQVNPGDRGDITLEAITTFQVGGNVIVTAYVTNFPEQFTMNFTASNSNVYFDSPSCIMYDPYCGVVVRGVSPGTVTITADASIPGYNESSIVLTVVESGTQS